MFKQAWLPRTFIHRLRQERRSFFFCPDRRLQNCQRANYAMVKAAAERGLDR